MDPHEDILTVPAIGKAARYRLTSLPACVVECLPRLALEMDAETGES